MSTARRALALAAAAVPALAVVLTGCGGGGYDEEAHRAALEEHLGHEVADWPTVRDITLEQCEVDEDRLQLDAAVAADRGEFTEYALGVEYACPDRSEEVESVSRQIEAYSGEAPE